MLQAPCELNHKLLTNYEYLKTSPKTGKQVGDKRQSPETLCQLAMGQKEHLKHPIGKGKKKTQKLWTLGVIPETYEPHFKLILGANS